MQKNIPTVDRVKVWLFPTLISILSAIIYYEVREMRQDVKELMAQSNVDKTRIDNLEKQIDALNRKVFYGSSSRYSAGLYQMNMPESPPTRFPPGPIITKDLFYESRKKKYHPREEEIDLEA
jgi:hypothetical protein